MKAIVLHSGGMDSSICLKLAINEFGVNNVTAMAFDYGQRHSSELIASATICATWGVARHVVNLGFLNQITYSAQLDHSTTIQHHADRPPNTFTVGRNGVMASAGAIYADHVGANTLWLGVIAPADAGLGYPDTTRSYIDLKQQLLRIDLLNPTFEIRTPLVDMTKSETLALAEQLGILNFLLKETVTCYEGVPESGCGTCPACVLRAEGLHNYLAAKKERHTSHNS